MAGSWKSRQVRSALLRWVGRGLTGLNFETSVAGAVAAAADYW